MAASRGGGARQAFAADEGAALAEEATEQEVGWPRAFAAETHGRYAASEAIPRATASDCFGEKGLILTTARFTAEARREAVRDGVLAIELVDGEAVAASETIPLSLRRTYPSSKAARSLRGDQRRRPGDQSVADEYVVMRFAEIIRHGAVNATIARALSRHAGNGGCVALDELADRLRQTAR